MDRTKGPRISVDVTPELWRRLRVAAAKRDVTVQQYLRVIVEEQLREDVRDEPLLALSAASDLLLAELWDNDRDAAYDRL